MTLTLAAIIAGACGIAPWFIWRFVARTQEAMAIEPAAVPAPVAKPDGAEASADRAA
ncbi:MAG: hypothetical protein AAFW69_12085 [Pseudomonadota bacterium]